VKNNNFKRAEFFVLCLCSLLAIYFFRNSELDLWAARLFYHPENLSDPWFEQDHKLWIFFYFAAPWLTGVLLLGSRIILGLSQCLQKLKPFRVHAVCTFLVVALGSGLFINGIFKPYWGRPRPREVMELGGKHEYQCFYSPAIGAPGKSFPCGHCSVGFSYGLLWWLLRRKKPAVATMALLGSLGVGGLMGIGRIAAGGHFFSDVIWSGLITYWVCYWVYYHVLKVPERELGVLHENDRLSRVGFFFQSHKSANTFIYSALATVTVLILLLASPFHQEILLIPSSSPTPSTSLNLKIEQASVDLILDETLANPFVVTGFAKGFGFPGSKVLFVCSAKSGEQDCTIQRKGFFSDFESVLQLKVNPKLIQKLSLFLRAGEVFPSENTQLPADYQIFLKK
jgi:membrane-associated PAP2 superfamily phosphatase